MSMKASAIIGPQKSEIADVAIPSIGGEEVLIRIDGLKINADFSHWCCVCESLLDAEESHMAAVIERTIHIHGRVGYAEGPQVSDPRAPEYHKELERHEDWWERIVQVS